MPNTFSQLIPLPDGSLSGYIALSDRSEYFVKVNAEKKLFTCDKHLQKKIDSYPDIRNGLFNAAIGNTQVIDKLTSFLEQSIVAVTSFDRKQNTRYIKEIAKLPSDIVKSIDKKFQLITLQYTDISGRTHFISLDLSLPNVTYLTSLPEPFTPPTNAFEDAYKSFTIVVDKYQDFWNVLDGIDSDTWVIEPSVGTRDIPRRRIVIAEGVSLIINIDPLQPNTLPRCSFLGSPDTVHNLQILLDENSSKWDSGVSIADNLSFILQVELPRKGDDSGGTDEQAACCICYEYNIDSEIPEVFCVQCTQNYHKSCLNEWFKSLPNVRHCFGTIFGECPYCSKAMHIQGT